MSKGWKKDWLRLKVEKESEKGEKLGKKKVQKVEKVQKVGKKWRKRQNLGSKLAKSGQKAAKGGGFQICANLKCFSL